MNADKIISALTPSELAVYKLRALFSERGYAQYKMSKFEEYELYMRNKDFLVSDNIITFTDEGGKLMALKPDVTLSIIKNCAPVIKEGCAKLCYNENVYRPQRGAQGFKEIMQVGLECVGEVGDAEIAEVIYLADRSLAEFSDSYALEISNLDVLSELFLAFGASAEAKRKITHELGLKNKDGILSAAEADGISASDAELIASLADIYGEPKSAIARLDKFRINESLCGVIDGFCALIERLSALGVGDNLFVDFSVVGNMKYYNGIAIKGYIDKIPASVLSGGQYDNLMSRMKIKSRGMGFAVYLDELERLPQNI